MPETGYRIQIEPTGRRVGIRELAAVRPRAGHHVRDGVGSVLSKPSGGEAWIMGGTVRFPVARSQIHACPGASNVPIRLQYNVPTAVNRWRPSP